MAEKAMIYSREHQHTALHTRSKEWAVFHDYRGRGYQVLKAGWPDLLVVKPRAYAFGVELKPDDRLEEALTPYQQDMKRVFEETIGIPYGVQGYTTRGWDPYL